MSYQHSVVLTLASAQIDVNVWDGYCVTSDLFAVANPWSFSLWRSSDAASTNEQVAMRTAWAVLQDNVALGDFVKLTIDGVPVMTGIIEHTEPHHSRDGAGIVISGRDGAATPVSWDGDPTINLRNQQIGDVLTALFAPYQLQPVFIDANSDAQVRLGQRPGSRGHRRQTRASQVDHTHVKIGEKAWQVAQEICRRLGYMLMIGINDSGGVAIIVDTPNYDGAVTFQLRHAYTDGSLVQVTDDSNVLEAKFASQIADVPTEVNVYGQNATGDTEDGRGKATVSNDFIAGYQSKKNPAVSPVTLPRIRHKHAERGRTQDQLRQEASRIISDANRNFRLYTCVVQGHGQLTTQAAGQQGQAQATPLLYAVNTMAHVRDDICLLDENMLIHRVEFKGSRREGQTTTLTLGTVGAIQLPVPAGQTAHPSHGAQTTDTDLSFLTFDSATGELDASLAPAFAGSGT